MNRRLEALEDRLTSSPGRPRWRTPGQEAERRRRFDELYRQIGLPPRNPEPKSRERVFGELFALMERWREEANGKERR